MLVPKRTKYRRPHRFLMKERQKVERKLHLVNMVFKLLLVLGSLTVKSKQLVLR